MGRPGLDPGTLGIEPDQPATSVEVQITWSQHSTNPPTSAEILSNVTLWLHHGLHGLGDEVSGDVKIRGADELDIQAHLEIANTDRNLEWRTD